MSERLAAACRREAPPMTEAILGALWFLGLAIFIYRYAPRVTIRIVKEKD